MQFGGRARAIYLVALVVVSGSPIEGRCKRNYPSSAEAVAETGEISDGCEHEDSSSMQGDMQKGGGSDELSFMQQLLLVSAGGAKTHMQPITVPAELETEDEVYEDTYTATNTTTKPPNGITANAVGDFSAFVTSFCLYTFGTLVLILGFACLRLRYPPMYSHNVAIGIAPSTPKNTLFGWVPDVKNLSIDDVQTNLGLDQAMMLEFTNMSIRIILIIGVPMFFIMGPINLIFGGNAAGADTLSYLSMGNVCAWDSDKLSCIDNPGAKQLYWVHSVAVWGVVFVVQRSVWNAQKEFMERRWEWLRGMPPLRANSVMVTGIPEDYRSEKTLRNFFNNVLDGDKVSEVNIVKDATEVETLFKDLTYKKARLKEAEATVAAGKQLKDGWFGKAPVISELVAEVSELSISVRQAQERVKEMAETPGGVNLGNAFVTFKQRLDAETALSLQISADTDEWEVDVPPVPSDILWGDLTQNETARLGRALIGYALIIALYFVYLPIVIGVTNLAELVKLPVIQPLWAGVAPTLGLQFMVSMLPTFLMLIFKFFHTLYAEAWAQHRLQRWYFWFQLIFVILGAALGNNATGFFKEAAENPIMVFGVMAESLPYSTHFFMNFMVLQALTHAMNLTRYIPLSKFKVFHLIFDEEDARELSEPEDQDYYGIGCRSARWSATLIICIVYGTLCPPLNVLTLLCFLVIRACYGYLICFAETKKPDLGGVFWCTMLNHLFVGNILYCCVMTAVFVKRAPNFGPAIVSGVSIAYVVFSWIRFQFKFLWVKLPFVEHKDMEKKRGMAGSYVQPELMPLS